MRHLAITVCDDEVEYLRRHQYRIPRAVFLRGSLVQKLNAALDTEPYIPTTSLSQKEIDWMNEHGDQMMVILMKTMIGVMSELPKPNQLPEAEPLSQPPAPFPPIKPRKGGTARPPSGGICNIVSVSTKQVVVEPQVESPRKITLMRDGFDKLWTVMS